MACSQPESELGGDTAGLVPGERHGEQSEERELLRLSSVAKPQSPSLTLPLPSINTFSSYGGRFH